MLGWCFRLASRPVGLLAFGGGGATLARPNQRWLAMSLSMRMQGHDEVRRWRDAEARRSLDR